MYLLFRSNKIQILKYGRLHKTYMRSSIVGLAALAIALIVLAGAVHAFSFYASNPALDISSCTTGYSTLYVSGAAPGSNVYFGATSGALQSQVSPSVAAVSSTGAASAVLSVSSPACFTGSLPVTVTANVCDPSGC